MAGFGQYIQNSQMGMTSNMEIPSMWQRQQQQQTFSNLNPAEYSYYYFPLEQQQLQFPAACDQYHNNFLSTTTSAHQGENLVAANDERRKSEVLLMEESVITTSNIIYKNNCSSASASTSSDFEGETNKQKKYRIGKGKKGRKVEKEEGKPGEVIHVRAKRGQATDSHSIAERVRREKINKKMRYLQDLVPGCHKTMGMAGMLEEIINYVHSLQNQVEFLSMELAAACSNKKSQGANNSQETTTEVEKWARAREQQYGGDYHTCFPSTWSL